MMAMHEAEETKGQRRRYKAAIERYFSDIENREKGSSSLMISGKCPDQESLSKAPVRGLRLHAPPVGCFVTPGWLVLNPVESAPMENRAMVKAAPLEIYPRWHEWLLCQAFRSTVTAWRLEYPSIRDRFLPSQFVELPSGIPPSAVTGPAAPSRCIGCVNCFRFLGGSGVCCSPCPQPTLRHGRPAAVFMGIQLELTAPLLLTRCRVMPHFAILWSSRCGQSCRRRIGYRS